MKNKRMLVAGLLAAAVASLGVVGAVSAFNGDDDPKDDVVLPVEPDGGIGDSPIPVEPDGGIGDSPIPVEPDGGIGDTPSDQPLPVEPDGGIGDTPDQGIDVGEPAPGTDPGRVMDPESAVKHHLSEARGIRVDDMKVVSYEKVTWPDGCRGVYFKDALCTMATVEGWIIVLAVDGPDATEYRYHGVNVDAELAPEGDFFTAVWELDEDDYRLGEPITE